MYRLRRRGHHDSPYRVYVILNPEIEEVWNPEDCRREVENIKRHDDLPLVRTVPKGHLGRRSFRGFTFYCHFGALSCMKINFLMFFCSYCYHLLVGI